MQHHFAERAIGLALVLTSIAAMGQQSPARKLLESALSTLVASGDVARYILPERTAGDQLYLDKIPIAKYRIESEADGLFTVLVDSGKGRYCVKLTFEVTKLGDKWYLVPGNVAEVEVQERITRTLSPWTSYEKICK